MKDVFHILEDFNGSPILVSMVPPLRGFQKTRVAVDGTQNR
jgi:hypothetical protein